MSFINEMKEKAKQNIKKIVLPETEDIRILKGTEIILKEGFAKIILLGNKDKIISLANENNINIEGAEIINPKKSDRLEYYIQTLYELRKDKGMTIENARKLLSENSRYFATMMV